MKYNKRYVILFDVWSVKTFEREQHEFDSYNQIMEYASFIDSIYVNTEETYDRYGYKKEWGYVVLDTQKEKVIKWSITKCIVGVNSKTSKLYLMDYLFRKDDEIPKDYKWDDGEYKGWLQYRWGDGKNAIGYKEKTNKKLAKVINSNDNEELIQDKYNQKELREKMYKKANKW